MASQPEPASDPAEEATRRAIDAALNYLSYRQRTEEEVRRKLAERGHGQETIEHALNRLRAVGLVDDESFVAAYVRDRVAHRPMGVRRMTRELWAKGIPREIAEPVIESVFADEGVDEPMLARRMARRRRRTRAKSSDDLPTFRRRLRHALMRRGFGPRLAREVVDEVFPPDEDAA